MSSSETFCPFGKPWPLVLYCDNLYPFHFQAHSTIHLISIQVLLSK